MHGHVRAIACGELRSTCVAIPLRCGGLIAGERDGVLASAESTTVTVRHTPEARRCRVCHHSGTRCPRRKRFVFMRGVCPYPDAGQHDSHRIRSPDRSARTDSSAWRGEGIWLGCCAATPFANLSVCCFALAACGVAAHGYSGRRGELITALVVVRCARTASVANLDRGDLA